VKIQQNNVAEFSFVSEAVCGDPFNNVELTVDFCAPDGTVSKVPAFWAGGGIWKARYSSDKTGTHSYTAHSNDKSLNGASGALEVVPYGGGNPLYSRGSICRQNNNMFLSYRDGTPFFWLADTWWMGLTKRLPLPGGFDELTADRVEKGFNVVQIVAGLYPDMPPFDERGANGSGFPWDPDFKSINPSYFDEADRKIIYLIERGITPCIVGSWGFFMSFAGLENLKRHWRYLIARWGAYPVVWCAAGEANMMYYTDEGVPYGEFLKQSRALWNEAVKYIHDTDAFGRLVTIHPTQNGHEQIDDESLLGLDMLQTGHSGLLSIAPTLRQVKAAVSRKKLPVIDGEVCYEGIGSSSYADVQRYVFWSCMLTGTCGHTYGANGIWQVNADGAPYGASPHGASWGGPVWRDAMNLPGSAQIGFAKKFLSQFEWWRFEPHPEWIKNSACSYEAADGCFAAGIPGEARVIFNPWYGGLFWGDVPIEDIEKDVAYHAYCFNTINGETIDLGPVVPDENGSWRPPRSKIFQDWVIALIAEA